MTILAVIQDACTVIGLDVPDAVMASTEREHVELRALANTMAKRIAHQTRDWTLLKQLATLTGDGVAESFPMPADYKRMLKKASIWPSNTPMTPLTHYPDTDAWLQIDVQNFTPVCGAWTLIGDRLHIKPVLAAGVTAKFFYLSKLIITPNGGGDPVAEFSNDGDTFRLDEEVLKLGIIWQWKANKGRPYAEDMANYEDALANVAGADKGSNILTVGRGRLPYGAEHAYPMSVIP